MTIAQWIRREGVTVRAERTDRNPNMDDAREMDHWRVTLRRRNGKRMSLVFSMGFGHQGKPPKAYDVLTCLASDSASVHNSRDFEDWAADMRWDADSRKAEKCYQAVQRQASRVATWAGEAY